MKIRLWPRGLIGQLLLAVAITLFIAQAINLALLVRGQRQQTLAHGGGMAVARIIDALDREARGIAEPLEAQDTRRGLRRIPKVRISAVAPPRPPRAVAAPELAGYVADLLMEADVAVRRVDAWALPQQPRIGRTRLPGRTVVVIAQVGERHYAVRSRVQGSANRLQGFLIWQTLSLYILLLVPIVFIAWRAAGPLRDLTRAARAGPAVTVGEPLEERGPSDVRDLISAFNAYRARIGAMLSDKDRMLGAVGHDLRTPLASLRVRVEAVADDPLREKMIASIDEMTAMLADILALARTGAGKEAAEAYEPAALLADIGSDYRAMGKAVSGPDMIPASLVLTGRPLLVRRALRNLVDNALAYAGQAVLAVDVSQGMVRLIVRDDGPGIDPARLADLVEPFARGEASRNRMTGGAGLGLAIASNLAEGEGGRLTLANRSDGPGLEAVIELPLRPDQQ